MFESVIFSALPLAVIFNKAASEGEVLNYLLFNTQGKRGREEKKLFVSQSRLSPLLTLMQADLPLPL